MALILADRVKEVSTTTGTGDITLGGASPGFQTFTSAIGTGNTCYYCITHAELDEWEVGIGTVGTGVLSRTTVLDSSTGGAAVSFSAGEKSVFVTYPAEKALSTDMWFVRTPINITPAAGSSTPTAEPILVASGYAAIYSGDTRVNRQFQVTLSTDTTFTSPVLDTSVNADSVQTPRLLPLTNYIWRCRDISLNSASAWSTSTVFTTPDIYIEKPNITYPLEGTGFNLAESATSSTYVVVNGDEAHVASYWVVKNTNGDTLYDSGRTTTSLTNISFPRGLLVFGETYTISVRYEGDTGRLSEWSDVRTLTLTGVPYDRYLIATSTAAPYMHIFGEDVDALERITEQPDDSTLTTLEGIAISPNGRWVAVVGAVTLQKVHIFERSGDFFTQVKEIGITRRPSRVAFSNDNNYLCVTVRASPYLTQIFAVDNGAFTFLTESATEAYAIDWVENVWSEDSNYIYCSGRSGSTGNARYAIYSFTDNVLTDVGRVLGKYPSDMAGAGVAVQPNGNTVVFLTQHTSQPQYYVLRYTHDRVANTFTWLGFLAPSDRPPAVVTHGAFSPDGTMYVVGSSTSPYITCYSISGTTWTKLANPAQLPTAAVNQVVFNREGTKLYLYTNATLTIEVYAVSGTTLTKLPGTPDSTIGGTKKQMVHWSPEV